MESKKNTPPKGVIIAVLAVIGIVIIDLILSSLFPELFQSMSTGETVPVKPE